MSANNSRLEYMSRWWQPSKGLWTVVCVALAVMLSLGNTLRTFAAPGDLDPTFGGNGKVTTNLPGDNDEASAVRIQADGKIVAAGFISNGSSIGHGDFAVTRYNTKGTLDNTFSTDGIVTTDFFGGYDAGFALAIQTNGKIVVGGRAATINQGANFALARYNTDGSLDTSFFGSGKTFTVFGGEASISALALQSDGKIVAAGNYTDLSGASFFALARYNSDGSIDTSFNGGTLVFHIVAGSTEYTTSIAIQSDGKIVVAGTSGEDFALARINSSGTMDTSFSTDGRVTTDFFGWTDDAEAVALQADGKIVVGGAVMSNTGTEFGLARYNTNGMLDTSFSVNGKTIADFVSTAVIHAIAIQPNGKIVAAGWAGVGSHLDFALARFNSGGALDTSFSGDGKVTTSFLGDSSIHSIAIQSDGKIVVAGVSDESFTTGHFALARYQNQ